MINNKKMNPVVIELFIRGRKLNISYIFISQSFFKALTNARLNFKHLFIMNFSKLH